MVDKDGAYLGGVICPGINLSIEALHQAAAQLPRIGIARPQAVIGRSTVPAMQSGVYWGYVAMIEGLVARIKAEFGGPMKVIATGGLAPLFSEGTTGDRTNRARSDAGGSAALGGTQSRAHIAARENAADRDRIGAWLVDTHRRKATFQAAGLGGIMRWRAGPAGVAPSRPGGSSRDGNGQTHAS